MTSLRLFVALAIAAIPCLAYGQRTSSGNPQLHIRSGPAAQPPDEQLLPASSALPVFPFDHKAYPQKYSAVYVPLSLAIGWLRTSEFTISKRSEWFDLMLQFEKPLPLQQMQCMTGTTSGPLDERLCEKDDPILGADWTVWLKGRIVQWGSIPKGCGCIFTAKDFFKQIGTFPLEKGGTYIVQVHFTKNATRLNAANPHLIIIPHQDMW